MPRKRDDEEVEIVQIKLRLRKSKHADLLAFFHGIPEGRKNQAVIARLRSGAPANEAEEQADTEELGDDDLAGFFS